MACRDDGVILVSQLSREGSRTLISVVIIVVVVTIDINRHHRRHRRHDNTIKSKCTKILAEGKSGLLKIRRAPAVIISIKKIVVAR